jgi:phage terminase small subunit
MPTQPLKKLGDQHIAFIEYYIQTRGNATEAALRAGYSKTSARVKGHELRTDPLVAAEIASRLAEQHTAAKVTSDAVIAELAALAFANLDDYVAWSGGGLEPNPQYISATDAAELEREKGLLEVLGQEVPKRITEKLDAYNNPLINTRSPYLDVPHRLTLTSSDQLTRQQKAAVGKVTFKPSEFGATVTVEMSGKLDALGKLANILGLNAPKKIEVAPNQLQNTRFTITRRKKAGDAGGVSSADTPS